MKVIFPFPPPPASVEKVVKKPLPSTPEHFFRPRGKRGKAKANDRQFSPMESVPSLSTKLLSINGFARALPEKRVSHDFKVENFSGMNCCFLLSFSRFSVSFQMSLKDNNIVFNITILKADLLSHDCKFLF